jgi:hypothetical protein
MECIATKLMIGLGMVLAGVAMYLLARSLMRSEAAVLAAVLYMFAPYHAVNLYVRGAVAELWAYAFLPLAFLGLVTVARSRSWRAVVIGAVGLAGVILSHNLTAFMLIPFYGFFYGFLLVQSLYRRDRLQSGLLISTLLLGLMLSCFYWLPALTEMKYTNVASQITGGSQYRDHYVCVEQLWAGVWGYAGSAPGCLDGISFQIGKLHVLLAGVAAVIAVFFSRKALLLGLTVGGGIAAVLMVLPISRLVWDMVPQIAYVQFPWRYLSFASFFFSLAGAGAVGFLITKYSPKKVLLSWLIVLVMCTGVVLFYSRYFQPQHVLSDYPDQTERTRIRWEIAKISDEYLPPGFQKPKSEKDVPQSLITGRDVSIKYEIEKNHVRGAQIITRDTTDITITTAVFPAWQFRVDGKSVTPRKQLGRYVLTLPRGTHTLTMQYTETPTEKVATVVSLIGIIISVVGIILWRHYYKNATKTS